MRQDPKENEIYRHFKGNMYQIVTLATDSETETEMVVYRALYGEGKVYVRPLEMFMSEVDRDKYPDADQTYRFEIVKDTLIDPGVMDFLDAETIEEKMQILSHLHPRITNQMIDTMSVSLDLDIRDGDVEERYLEFQGCLTLLQKYEGSSRLR